MNVKSYMTETLAAIFAHEPIAYDNLRIKVCGQYMGSGELLQECLETLVALGLISANPGTDPESETWETTALGVRVATKMHDLYDSSK